MIDAGRVEILGPVIFAGLLAMWAAYDERKWPLGVLAGLIAATVLGLHVQ